MFTIALRFPLPRTGSSVGRVAAALWARWRHYVKLRETRRYLQQMDERTLQDIGVSRAQALFELDTDSWRG